MRKLNDTISRWPEDPLRKPFKRFVRLVIKEVKRAKNWLFFYQPKDKFDEMIHIFDLIVLVYLAIRLLSRG